MVILQNPLNILQTTSQTINQYQSNFLSNTGSFNNPLDLYLAGHRTYSDIPYEEKINPDISGIIKNINLLQNDIIDKPPSKNLSIYKLKKELLNDITLESNINALSIQLKTNTYTIKVLNNYYKNL